MQVYTEHDNICSKLLSSVSFSTREARICSILQDENNFKTEISCSCRQEKSPWIRKWNCKPAYMKTQKVETRAMTTFHFFLFYFVKVSLTSSSNFMHTQAIEFWHSYGFTSLLSFSAIASRSRTLKTLPFLLFTRILYPCALKIVIL